MNRRKAFVVKAIEQPLSTLRNHHDVVGLTRQLFCSRLLDKRAPFHVAVHNFDGKLINRVPGEFHYTEPHAHDVWELDLVVPSSRNFLFQFEVDGEVRFIKTASTLLVPPGVEHRMEVVRGTGMMLCIVCSGSYARSLMNRFPNRSGKPRRR
jgi:hypothetical protein